MLWFWWYWSLNSGRKSIAWVRPPALFALVILVISSCFFFFFCPVWPGPWSSYFTLSVIARMDRLMQRQSSFSYWDRFSPSCYYYYYFFFLAWASLELQSSLSQLLTLLRLGWQAEAMAPNYWLRWVLKTFCPGWFPSIIFTIPISQVASITGVSHQHAASTHIFKYFFMSLLSWIW
jgi:hypothetical protein